jgi:ABC-type polysaccharide/polyol phosphate transport system ATPase subunit
MNTDLSSTLIRPGKSVAIELQGAGVMYIVPSERLSGLKEYAIRWMQRKIQFDQFWALRNVDLAIQRGETLGIIGRNGAGKSTLLKLVARVLIPTEGRVVVHGAVVPLLELGAGFHPELTGRENIYLNGTLLGKTRAEMDLLFESIVGFAELRDFIDAPIRTYSTGMVARLGFSIATSSVPRVLIVDEVLSVGDVAFQQKCLARMRGFQTLGTTILLVSHSMPTVKSMCHRVAWLSGGHIQAIGPAEDVVSRYLVSSETED